MKKLNLIGTTVDGKPIVSGRDIFRMHDTHGFPFSMSFIECEERGWMIDWIGLVKEARQNGWFDSQTWDHIQDAFTDSGSWKTERPEIESRLKFYILQNAAA